MFSYEVLICFSLSDPPSAPVDIKVFNITSKSASLKWSQPNEGWTSGGFYFIECVTCSNQDNFPRNTTELHIFLHGLGSYGDYSLKVGYRNAAANLTKKFSSGNVNFKTLPGSKFSFTLLEKND